MLIAYQAGFFFSFEDKYSTENKYSLIQCRLHDIVHLGLRIILYCHMPLYYTNPNSIFSVCNNNADKHNALWSVFLLT